MRPRSAHLSEAQQAAYQFILELFEDPAQANEQNIYLLDNDQRDWGTDFAFFQVNDKHIRWTRAEQAAAERFGVGTANYDAFVSLWDDIALSTELGTGWARVDDFGDGQDLAGVTERGIDLLDFMYDRRPSGGTIDQAQFYLGGGLDRDYPGIITTSDMTTFAGFVRLKLLSPSVIEFLDPDHNIINEYDINNVERLDFLIETGLPTEALGRVNGPVRTTV